MRRLRMPLVTTTTVVGGSMTPTPYVLIATCRRSAPGAPSSLRHLVGGPRPLQRQMTPPSSCQGHRPGEQLREPGHGAGGHHVEVRPADILGSAPDHLHPLAQIQRRDRLGQEGWRGAGAARSGSPAGQDAPAPRRGREDLPRSPHRRPSTARRSPPRPPRRRPRSSRGDATTAGGPRAGRSGPVHTPTVARISANTVQAWDAANSALSVAVSRGTSLTRA